MFVIITTYAFPLLVIIASYGAILIEISRKSRECTEQTRSCCGDDSLRRSGVGNMGRAKSRTLKMTILIVAVFILCWTPYYVMCLWHWFEPESAQQVDYRVQRGLFLFACSNSCMNPIVYGMFSMNCTRDCRRLRNHTRSRHNTRGHSKAWSDRTVLDSQVLQDVESHETYTCVTNAISIPNGNKMKIRVEAV